MLTRAPDGGEPRPALAVPAEQRAGDGDDRAVRAVIESEAAECYRPGPEDADFVADPRPVEDLAQPFFRGGEPVGPRRKRDLRRLAPANQASAVPDPGCQRSGGRARRAGCTAREQREQ